MIELRPVAGPRSPFRGHGGQLAAVVVIAILVAMLKPWGDQSSSSTAVAPPTPSPAVTSRPTVAPPRTLDFLALWPKEPKPRWELWPAGYLVSFGFAMRVDDVPVGPGDPVVVDPAASGAPAPSAPGSSPAPTPTPAFVTPAPAPPAWPRELRIPAGNHLYVIGLNRPLGFDVRIVGLTRFEDDGSARPGHVVIGASPWPDHFTIIGLAADDGSSDTVAWPPGRYRLDVLIDPGAVERSVDIVIEAADEPVPASAAPGG